ncbi:MAG: hypothetical protein JHC63_01375 [Acidimicrobiia bacterium]|nr:hypothetical protein [Acidimicrobiia bacterium]
MPAYDPQRTRNRPAPATDRPAPVDAFLDAMPPSRLIPEGVDSDTKARGDAVVNAADTDGAVNPIAEESVIDAAPRVTADVPRQPSPPVVRPTSDNRSKIAIAVIAATIALVAVLLLRRKRR